MDNTLLTVQEAANLSRMTPAHIRLLARTQGLVAQNKPGFGTLVFIDRASLEHHMKTVRPGPKTPTR